MLKNWRTTLLGLAVALLTAGPDIAKLFDNGVQPKLRIILLTIATALWGYFTKDRGVTGKS